MKKYAEMLLIFTLVLALLPSLISYAAGVTAVEGMPSESVNLKETSSDYSNFVPAATISGVNTVTLYNTESGSVETVMLEDYVARAVYGSMPASFGAEALKAQCVVIRTIALYRAVNNITCKHSATFCDDEKCCLPYKTYDSALGEVSQDVADSTYKAVLEATKATQGQYLSYGGEVINALFHASSAGRTASGEDVIGQALPCLSSVTTPDESGFLNYKNEYLFVSDEFMRFLGITEYNPDSSQWDLSLVTDGGGRCRSAVIEGKEFKGTELMHLLGLASANMEFSFSGGLVRIVTLGSGHGLGMSQYGAGLMSLGGKSYEEILAHYYRRSELKST